MSSSIVERIANEVGVSPATVYRALSSTDRQSAYGRIAKRIDRIRHMAEQLGYRPNAAAKATAKGRFGTVAALVSPHMGEIALPLRLWASIQETLAKHDLNFMIARLPDTQLTESARMPKVLEQAMSDGLLITYNRHIPPRMMELIERHDIPAVWINVKHDHDCVYPDDEGAGFAATLGLLRHGHTKIAYVDLSHVGQNRGEWHYSARDREEGYLRAMADAGLRPHIVRFRAQSEATHPRRYETCRQLLSEVDRPTAVITYSSAATLVETAISLGLSVPRDLSVITFADDMPTMICGGVATMRLPQKALGAQAVEMLMRKIAEPQRQWAAVAVPLAFVAGDSVASL
jgi:LacI family transcriptional regulator